MKWDIFINQRVDGKIVTAHRTLEVPGTSRGDLRSVYLAANRRWGIAEDAMLAIPHLNSRSPR